MPGLIDSRTGGNLDDILALPDGSTYFVHRYKHPSYGCVDLGAPFLGSLSQHSMLRQQWLTFSVFALSQFDYRDDGGHLLKGTLSSLPSRLPAPYVLFERFCVRQDKEKDGFKMWWMLHAHVGMTGMPVSTVFCLMCQACLMR